MKFTGTQHTLAGYRWVSLLALVLLGAVSGCGEQSNSIDPPPKHPGEDVYVRYCASCHNAGVAEAPILGDREQWAPRLEQGMDAMLTKTLEGVPPGMPKKGLCMSCSDTELKNAIDYMLDALEDVPSS